MNTTVSLLKTPMDDMKVTDAFLVEYAESNVMRGSPFAHDARLRGARVMDTILSLRHGEPLLQYEHHHLPRLSQCQVRMLSNFQQ